MIVEMVAVAVSCTAVVVLFGSAWMAATVPVGAAHLLLTLVAAAVGAGTGILAMVAARLLGDPSPAWIAAALVLYCVIVLPWTTVAPAAGLELPERLSRLIVYLTALLLLVLSIRPPRRLGTWGGWALTGVGGGLAVAVLWLPDGPFVRSVVEGQVSTAVVLVAWTVTAAAFVVDGARRRDASRLRFGIGLVVLTAAQLYRVAVVAPTADGDLAFAALRLAGLLIVLAGFARCVQLALRALRMEQWQQQEDLTAAALHLERAGELSAERDHELRNGLAGLAGITHLLDAGPDDKDHEPLKHAVLAELGRLHMILDGPVIDVDDPDESDDSDDDDPAVDYLVEPVLSGLVTLRRSRGERVGLRVDAALRARGHATVLAQVVTNLLANCDRHAPGAAITIAGRRDGDAIVVDVQDDGPGLKRGIEGSVLERGVRDESAGGSGLGLHISRRLLARDGGTVDLRGIDGSPGCLATVTVPMAGSPQPAAAHAGSTFGGSGR